jgi:hypothetical protein
MLIQFCFYPLHRPWCIKPKNLTLELVLNESKLLCVVQTSPNTFILVAKLGIEGNTPSLFYGDGT